MDLYYVPLSTPCRTVLMTAEALGIKLNRKEVAMMDGEHLKPEFIKLNPQHTIPTLVDDGFAIWESRAIIVYLVEKYGKTDSLYPKCPTKRAEVNQRLFFDLGTLNQAFGDYFRPQYKENKPADPELFKNLENALNFLNIFLEGQEYVAGDTFTVADISILCTISAFVAVDVDLSKYANITRWYEHTQKVAPGWEESWNGALALRKHIDNIKNQSK